MPAVGPLYLCEANAYPGLSPEQVALLDRLCRGHTIRARTAEAGAFRATVSSIPGALLPYDFLDVVPDDRSIQAVRGRTIDADTLASWVSQIEPL